MYAKVQKVLEIQAQKMKNIRIVPIILCTERIQLFSIQFYFKQGVIVGIVISNHIIII